jgi:hypothetical protein
MAGIMEPIYLSGVRCHNRQNQREWSLNKIGELFPEVKEKHQNFWK